MNKSRFGHLAFTDHTFANPLSSAKVERVLALLNLEAGQRVLDVGCGNAEILMRLIERYHVHGVGVDTDTQTLALAHESAATRVPSGSLTLHDRSIANYPADETFDAALCLGATHAYGDYSRTLHALAQRVQPGGHVLVGEGFWKQSPAPAYLDLLQATPDEMRDHAGNAASGAEAGLTFLYAAVSNEDEWDEFEGLYLRAIKRFADANPHDPDAVEFREYIRRWHEGYLRYGRATLGFALYLFLKPHSV